MNVSVLGLRLPTDPRWVNLTEISLQAILTDHAYCEQKATSTCISLIQQFPHRTYLVEQVMPVVAEEWSHFRMVVAELKKRNLKLGRQRKDEYVIRLMEFVQKGGNEEGRLIDKLLFSALIEARSCERFRLLSEHISELELREFYRNLMIAEAGHYKLFLNIAKHYSTEEKVLKRWREYLDYEAGIMAELEVRGDRIH
ncbi:MAG: tRNA-(ms[2]io[6]A)-hydroxylase [Chitinophagales bacterium]